MSNCFKWFNKKYRELNAQERKEYHKKQAEEREENKIKRLKKIRYLIYRRNYINEVNKRVTKSS